MGAVKHMVLYDSAITISKERIHQNKYKNSVNTTQTLNTQMNIITWHEFLNKRIMNS